MPKIGKLEQKAIDLAKAQVIAANGHKYCPAIYYHKPEKKFILAMELDDENGGFGICYVNQQSVVKAHFSERRTTLMKADQDLTRIALRVPNEEIYEKRHDGFDLYDMRLADEGKGPQNKNLPAKSDTVSLLDPVAAQINEEFAVYEDLEKQATMSMLKIGIALEAVKEQLPHGQLQKWIAANLTISYRHAKRFRELAIVFIKAQQIDPSEMLALVDPENSKAALGDKLRQMAFEFLGDKTQAELFAEYGIQVREQKQLGGKRDTDKEPKLSLADKKRLATELIEGLQNDIQRQCLDDTTRKLHLLAPTQLKSLEADLVSSLLNVRDLLN